MRFEINQELFAVQFTYVRDLSNPCLGGLFRQPMLYDNEFPVGCNFVRLTVESHHKVCNKWDEKGAEPKYDGFLLKNDDGALFANQYPYASYGQTSDTADRRFKMYSETEGEILKLLKEKPETPYEYHLLSDVLESIQRSIKDLAKTNRADPVRDARIKEKVALLPVLYDLIVKAFNEVYPSYEVKLEWEPALEGSSLIWPNVTFHEKVSEANSQ